MFDIGFWEIALIMVLALVILGPERLPHAARTVGRFVGKARRYIEGVKSEVEKEFDTGELKRILHNQEVQIRELQGKLTEAGDEISNGLNQQAEELNKQAEELGEFNDDDPGNPHQEQKSEVISSYDMFEEGDDGYDELEVSRKPAEDQPETHDATVEHLEKKPEPDKSDKAV